MPVPKRLKRESDDASMIAQARQMRDRALELWIAQMDQGTEALYKQIYGEEHWEAGAQIEKEKLEKAQAERRELNKMMEKSAAERKEKAKVSMKGSGVYLDDLDMRY